MIRVSVRRTLGTALLACMYSAPTAAAGQAASETEQAYKFILDYDVPESPAFAALGVTPTNVLRASSAKPVAASLLNQIASGDAIEAGLAIDFAPYLVYGGGFRSYREYATTGAGAYLKRLAANTLVSLGTVQGETESEPLRYGAGIRVTLYDKRSLLQNRVLADTLSTLLSAAADDPGTEIGPDPQPTRRTVDLSSAYVHARNVARRTPGFAASAGFATAGTLNGSVVAADSIITTANRAWLTGSYSLKHGFDILANVQLVDGPGVDQRVQSGVALRANTSAASFALELAHDSEVGGILPGANAEIRLVRRVTLVAALVSDGLQLRSVEDARKLRIRTSLKWNMSETQ